MKSIWDRIVDGECPWDDEQRCPLDCHRGEDYCMEFRRIRFKKFREEDFKQRIQDIHDYIKRGECPMYGGKCPEDCYRTNDTRYPDEDKRCNEWKILHNIFVDLDAEWEYKKKESK
jgi:hypothetical protein